MDNGEPTHKSDLDKNPDCSFSRPQDVKALIKQYFTLLTNGCGNPECLNTYCFSSSKFYRKDLSPNEAAVEAIRLVKEKVPVHCTTNLSVTPSAPPSLSAGVKTPYQGDNGILTEAKVNQTINLCKQEGKWSELIKLIGSSFSDVGVLMKSFLLANPAPDMLVTLDFPALERSFSALFSIPEDVFMTALIIAVENLSTTLVLELRYRVAYERNPTVLNVLMILLEMPCLENPAFIERAYPQILQAFSYLSLPAEKSLVLVLASRGSAFLRPLLKSLQQLITIKIVTKTTRWSTTHIINDDTDITSAVKLMRLIYYASIVGGKSDSLASVMAEKAYFYNLKRSVQLHVQGLTNSINAEEKINATNEDPLAQSLCISPVNCREPLIPYSEFINDVVNETLEADQDFNFYKADIADKFSFVNYSFILNTSTKYMHLYYDNRRRMLQERRAAIVSSFLYGGPQTLYLRLRVRRDNIIADSLIALEMVYLENPGDLKKQLYIEFEGEQGIDEGGVTKEFFQLIIEEIFNPDFGMFTYDEENRLYWFNADSYENEAQFTLVGTLLGLAIYNNAILDVRFPMVVYRKLMGKLGFLEDMKLSHPVLYSSLNQMLSYDGMVEEDFMTSFTLSRKNMFGETVVHPLKEGGADLLVNNANRQEFCDLYADCLLNKLTEKQFNAFYKGFHMVVDESPLEMLFNPAEIEELICGSNEWDITALEESTEYDGGFTKDSETIRHFWHIVHSMSREEHKQLLQFTTGSDRVPVGGLAKLKLIIARNGPDSDRLPTSHTCFNVLLLPDYKNFDKLKNRVMLAITHAKGFGML